LWQRYAGLVAIGMTDAISLPTALQKSLLCHAQARALDRIASKVAPRILRRNSPHRPVVLVMTLSRAFVLAAELREARQMIRMSPSKISGSAFISGVTRCRRVHSP
jgi:hypothetical protein